MQIKLSELAKIINCQLEGEDCLITNVADISQAKQGDVVFVSNEKYKVALKKTQATAVIASKSIFPSCDIAILYSEQPRLAFAKAATYLNTTEKKEATINPNASIDGDATIDASATIEANVVIKNGVSIGAYCHIGAGCVIEENCKIGQHTQLNPNVTVYHGCEIGEHCILHAGVVIGADGFGFEKDKNTYYKVPQLGRVKIANHVEIGANTTIDRGALLDTVIADGVKLDNQIQIGHNVSIGAHTVISACSCIAGSVKIGQFCLFGGSIGIRDNIEICDNVMITGRTLVSRSITKAGSYSSSTPMDTTQNWRKNAVRFRQLDKLAKRVKTLELELDKVKTTQNNKD